MTKMSTVRYERQTRDADEVYQVLLYLLRYVLLPFTPTVSIPEEMMPTMFVLILQGFGATPSQIEIYFLRRVAEKNSDMREMLEKHYEAHFRPLARPDALF